MRRRAKRSKSSNLQVRALGNDPEWHYGADAGKHARRRRKRGSYAPSWDADGTGRLCAKSLVQLACSA